VQWSFLAPLLKEKEMNKLSSNKIELIACTHVISFKLTKKEASTVLCSLVKHAGSSTALKKSRGKHETNSSVFPNS